MFRGVFCLFFFFKQKTAYEMRISDWSSDVCSSDLEPWLRQRTRRLACRSRRRMPAAHHPRSALEDGRLTARGGRRRIMDRTVALFGSDPALLYSLRFALTLDGFTLSTEAKEAAREACLLIVQAFQGNQSEQRRKRPERANK